MWQEQYQQEKSHQGSLLEGLKALKLAKKAQLEAGRMAGARPPAAATPERPCPGAV